MQHHAYSCTYPEGCNCGASRVNAMEEEIARLRAENARLQSEVNRKDCRVISRRIDGGEAWLWQGDGDDRLESLTCPVVIRPDALKRIIDDRAKLREDASRLEPVLEACAELANAAEDDEHQTRDLDGAIDKVAGELFRYRNPEAFT